MNEVDVMLHWRERAKKAEAELERVKAREAEMREVLEKTRHYHLGTPDGIPNEWFIRRDKALSSFAGTGYVRKEEYDREEANHRKHNWEVAKEKP